MQRKHYDLPMRLQDQEWQNNEIDSRVAPTWFLSARERDSNLTLFQRNVIFGVIFRSFTDMGSTRIARGARIEVAFLTLEGLDCLRCFFGGKNWLPKSNIGLFGCSDCRPQIRKLRGINLGSAKSQKMLELLGLQKLISEPQNCNN